MSMEQQWARYQASVVGSQTPETTKALRVTFCSGYSAAYGEFMNVNDGYKAFEAHMSAVHKEIQAFVLECLMNQRD